MQIVHYWKLMVNHFYFITLRTQALRRSFFTSKICKCLGFYKNTPMDKVLNFDVDINGLKHIEWILELHVRHDKKATVYTPKLYLAITSKPVAELSGNEYKYIMHLK